MKTALGLVLLLAWFGGQGQSDAMRFGISVRPIIPFELLDTGSETLTVDALEVEMNPRTGFNFGMFVQQPLGNNLAVESGIFAVRRNYRNTFVQSELDTTANVRFAFVGYEIPIQALFYVQLGKRLWMNGSGGISLDMYPSDVFTSTGLGVDTAGVSYTVSTARQHWAQFALVANYGFEFRAPKGIGYLGVSYHRPFNQIGTTRSKLEIDGVGTTVEHAVRGSYLTLDVRFIFPEAPKRRRP